MTPFELTMSLPHDARFASTLRELAMQAAQHAGCAQARAEAFGRAAEELLRRCLEETGPEDAVPVVMRRDAGPLVLRIDDRTITLEIAP